VKGGAESGALSGMEGRELSGTDGETHARFEL
jgi:hypothetical protein